MDKIEDEYRQIFDFWRWYRQSGNPETTAGMAIWQPWFLQDKMTGLQNGGTGKELATSKYHRAVRRNLSNFSWYYECLWYLYQMVTQRMWRTHEKIRLFGEKFQFVT